MHLGKILLLSISVIMIGYGCKKADNNEQSQEPQGYDRGLMLKDVTNNVILPSHKKFVDEAIALSNALSVIGTKADMQNISAAQTQWQKCVYAWRACEAMNIGEVKEAYIHNKVYSWPTNTDFINSFISSADNIDEQYIDSKGSSSKGLAAIEYLLFGDNNSIGAVVDSLNTIPRKLEYLIALGENLKNVAVEINNLWIESKDNYQARFISSTGTDFGSSTHHLVNEMVGLLEKMLKTKLGKPLGKTTDNSTYLELLEAYRGRYSLQLFNSNLQALKKMYHGGSNDSDAGIDDYLNAVGAKYGDISLSEKIGQQFKLVEDKINRLNSASLYDALSSNRQTVELLYEETQNLLVLFKVDVISNLSITLVLNDNDGD